ncbi:unnamed protein product [Zymoseptoria tritici ST99CH_1E4]|uniref:Extracellular membrane protein CFEM domain-containing protein n=1 Tax=Zymoseptoria tritici ST99CH_1E4 TaxID=1276532 RepID=A0A2H1FJB0_ZYMTR|nr:unnamed protein product [Zymoseptoria tritici ST99CH_1E4]
MSPSINIIMLLGAAVAWAENAPMGYGPPPAATTTAAAGPPPGYGPPPASTTAGSSPADCAATCFAAYRDCQTNPPDSNKSLCASNLASCLGYNPFDNSGTFVTPTACSTSAPATATAPAPASTTAPAGDAAQCAATCFAAYRDCQTNPPDSNKSLCASNLAKCLNYNPFDNSGTFVTPTACSASSAPATATAPPATTTPAGDAAACAATCFKAYRDCQTNPPDSNKSLCASNLAKCLNYNPFDNSGTFVTPTACSASSAPATATAPPATTTPAGDAAACAATCFKAYRDCQTNPPDSNKSLCASNLAKCLNYNPFDNSNTFITPTACSTSGAPATATAPAPSATTPGSTTPDACAQACNDADHKCRFAPDANMSFCASELAKCLGYNPYDNSNTFITPTACSTSGAPAPTGGASGMPTGNMPTGNGNMPTGTMNMPTHAGNATATSTNPAQYTGAASLLESYGSFVAVAAGAVAMMV